MLLIPSNLDPKPKKTPNQVECFFIDDKLYINSKKLSSEENE